jgi:hypothetical protein
MAVKGVATPTNPPMKSGRGVGTEIPGARLQANSRYLQEPALRFCQGGVHWQDLLQFHEHERSMVRMAGSRGGKYH